MKQFLTMLISATILLSFSSCSDSRDKLMQDQVDYLNEMAEVIEEVADGSMSSSEAAEKFAEMRETGDEFMERKKVVMKDISDEDGQALIKKYSKQSGEAMKRYVKTLEQLRDSGRVTQELRDAIQNIK